MFCDVNADGQVDETEVIQEDHYYPFGMRHEGYGRTIAAQGENFYQFNGTEKVEDFNLDWHHTLFRSYDPAVGRWHQIDPKNSARESGFVGLGNNPILYSDMLGDTIIYGMGAEWGQTVVNHVLGNSTSENVKNKLNTLNSSDVHYRVNFLTDSQTKEHLTDSQNGTVKYNTDDSKDGKTVIDIYIRQEGIEVSGQFGALGDETEHALQFENGNMGEAVLNDETVSSISYNMGDEIASKDAEVEMVESVGMPLTQQQQAWKTAKANGQQEALLRNIGYSFDNSSMPNNLSNVSLSDMQNRVNSSSSVNQVIYRRSVNGIMQTEVITSQ